MSALTFVEWLWGHKFGLAPFVKSWRPFIDAHRPRGYRGWMLWQFALQNWGVAWPLLGDRKIGGTSQPIWNWTWLRNRLGFPYRFEGGGAM
jgi:hypothetical protein